MKCKTHHILILIIIGAFTLLHIISLHENFTTIPGGSCVTQNGVYGRIDPVSKLCIGGKPNKNPSGFFKPCGTNKPPIPNKIPCTAPYPNKIPVNPDPNPVIPPSKPINQVISNLIKTLDGHTIPLPNLPKTPCLPINSDFEDKCKTMYGANYGYMHKYNCPNGKQATCSQTYRMGQPRYYQYTTDCGEYNWDGTRDRMKFAKQCRNIFGYNATLSDISSLGCGAPNQAMGVCTL